MNLNNVFRWLGLVDAAPTPAHPDPPRRLAPHEQYPEIMHWREGDEIRSSTHSHWFFWFKFISVTEDGTVYGDSILSDHKFRCELWVIMRDGSNLTLNDREISQELQRSNEYIELIKEFNAAFASLQERDNAKAMHAA